MSNKERDVIDNREIIELANIIAERPCDSEDCAPCIRMGRRCNDYLKAERAIAAGYRKQSNDVPDTNVGCKFCENDSLLDDLVCYIPTDDGASIDPPVRYCPFCGSKMKGV